MGDGRRLIGRLITQVGEKNKRHTQMIRTGKTTKYGQIDMIGGVIEGSKDFPNQRDCRYKDLEVEANDER